MKELSEKQRIRRFNFYIGFIIVTLPLAFYCGFRWGVDVSKYDTSFDSQVFNNLATPIATIITFLVVLAALRESRRQNQIILSQHRKPVFIAKIDKLKKTLEAHEVNDIDTKFLKELDMKANGLTFPILLGRILYYLQRLDRDYLEDKKQFNAGQKFKIDYYENRSYYRINLFLTSFLSGERLRYLKYENIETLISEIKSDELLPKDKAHLFDLIKNELLFDYFDLIERYDRSPGYIPLIPDLFNTSNPDGLIEVTLLNKSIPFRKYYDILKACK